MTMNPKKIEPTGQESANLCPDPRQIGLPLDARSLEELSAADAAKRLGLEPHREGGYFRETYRAAEGVHTEAGMRPLTTAILYLLTADGPSRFHRLNSDELWFYHAGAVAEVVLLPPLAAKTPGRLPAHRPIGLDCPQALVPAHWWVGARVISESEADWGSGRTPERRWVADRRSSPEHMWTLVSCVVTPGFEYDDFELGDRESLLRSYPLAREVIIALT
jgi:predicted cupin superfamily sugar epimerase